jgi:hypothetical protein
MSRNLSPAGDEIGQQPRRFVGQWAHLWLGRLGEVGDDGSIDGIGLGTLPDRLGEGADLRRIDDHHRQARSGQCGRRDRLEAAGGLQGDNAR